MSVKLHEEATIKASFPPSGIHPLLWSRIKAKRKRNLKAEVRALYKIDPILWAVVKGHDTPNLLTDRFPDWTTLTTHNAIARSLRNNHIKIWGGRYLPVEERYKVLKKRLSSQ